MNLEYGADNFEPARTALKLDFKCSMSALFPQVGVQQLLGDVRARLQFGTDGFSDFFQLSSRFKHHNPAASNHS